MKVMFFCGSHPRHLYVASRLFESNLLHSLVVEKREQLMPQPPASILNIDKQNFLRHFRDREEAEIRFFGMDDFQEKHQYFLKQGVPVIVVDKDGLNGEKVSLFVKGERPDIVITYGVHKIEQQLLAEFPTDAWNIHGGLSPWYRGNTTLFWPFYFLQPNWAGMTVHQLTDKIDAGEIVHHSVPQLEKGDGIHDVACKAVQQVTEDIITILNMKLAGKVIQAHPQGSAGKLFISRDWHPSHLRLIYNTFNNDIVDAYLDGAFSKSAPKLIRAF